MTTQYLVDDLNPTGLPQVVEEVVNGAVTRQYTYGLQRISENQIIANLWTPSFYEYDGGGSVRQLTNSTGQVTDKYEYDAFGHSFTLSGTTPNNYLYQGEQFDSDLGLYYLRARYYNPQTGRFLSRDPEDGDYTDPKTLHKYLYANGDPVNGIDPMGREDFDEFQFLKKEVSLGASTTAYKIAAAEVSLLCQVVTAVNVITYFETREAEYGPPGEPLPLKAGCGVVSLASYIARLPAIWASILAQYAAE